MKRPIRVRQRTRKLQLQQLEIRNLLASIYMNPIGSLDVNEDKIYSPLDALLVINQLNLQGSIKLPETRLEGQSRVDVNGDKFQSPLVALLVINRRNLVGSGPAVRRVSDGTSYESIDTIRVASGQSIGTRQLRLNVAASLGDEPTASFGDLLTISVISASSEGQTLLDS